MNRYKKISTKTLFRHQRTTLTEDAIKLPNGKESTYLVYDNIPDSAVMLVIQNGQLLLSREYTYPMDDYLLQIPGGAIESNEDPLAAARRELLEETGYIASGFEYLGYVLQNHRRSCAKMHYYLVTGIEQSEHQREEHEFIELDWFDAKRINEYIINNKITHEGTLAGLMLLRTKYPKLF